MKPINDLTPDELRREIARRLGWTELTVPGIELQGRTPDHQNYLCVPNWPADPGAALMLCAEIADNVPYSLQLEWAGLKNGKAAMTAIFRDMDGRGVHSWTGVTTTALALARLALAALRGKDNGDET